MADDGASIADITFEDHVFDLAFHPTRDVVAAGLINGVVELHGYGIQGNTAISQLRNHRKACRALRFSADGNYLFTSGKDKSIQAVDMNTGVVAYAMQNAHSAPINSMVVVSESFIATGDDKGTIKIWDLRQSTVAFEISENEDFIADMWAQWEGKKTLLAACGDGTLSVVSLRRKALEKRSVNLEDELLSVEVVRNGTKVVCGSQEGILDIYSWGEWDDISDRFPGHPNSIDTIAKITESIVATGSSDGLIRVVSILPNKLLGVVGEHENFPIERIRTSRDMRWLGSCSHDSTIKFWNIEDFFEAEEDGTQGEATADVNADGDDGGGDADMETDEPAPLNEQQNQNKPSRGPSSDAQDFFSDL